MKVVDSNRHNNKPNEEKTCKTHLYVCNRADDRIKLFTYLESK